MDMIGGRMPEAGFSVQRRGVGSAAAWIAAGSALALARPAAARGGSSQSLQNVVANGADPTGLRDSSQAFQQSFANLPGAGGTIYVQGGVYRLDNPLNMKNKPVEIVGDGSAATVLLLNHTQWGMTYTCTNIINSEAYPFQMAGFSLAGVAPGPAAGAIWAAFGSSGAETGYQSCRISDIGIGNAYFNGASGCNIKQGLFLENIWKSQIDNVRMFANPSDGGFVILSSADGGLVIDNTFTNCFHDGGGAGFRFFYDGNTGTSTPFQGLNIISPKLLNDYGIYAPNAYGNPPGNILGLFLTGGTVASRIQCLLLQEVWNAQISDCAFSCFNPNANSVVELIQCVACGIVNCSFNGAYSANTGVGAGTYAINVGVALNRMSALQFGNVLNGLQYTPGAISNLALGLQLVDPSSFPQLAAGPAAIDNSGVQGDGRNNAQWLNKTGQIASLY